ncbi:MAG: electron transfer flavoprotein subunit alpha/FixB family protein [Limisphaerales bacterium]
MAETLVLIEHDGDAVKRSSLGSIALARELGGDYALLVLGSNPATLAESVRAYGSSAVLVVSHPSIAEPVPDQFAEIVAEVARRQGAKNVVATSSTFSKDILPRVAALLDAPMLTDVSAVRTEAGAQVFVTPISAGSLLATLRLDGPVRVLSARPTAYQAPDPGPTASPVESVDLDVGALTGGIRFVSRERTASSRPDLGDARIVVCGGRPLKDKETFEVLIGGLADALGAAVGATRAAVDAGMAPNDWQVGQTGKTVAPELYIGIGVSGAIQHMAGIQDSRVIVAINRDADAPMLQTATYGLVGDLFEIVPKFVQAVRR